MREARAARRAEPGRLVVLAGVGLAGLWAALALQLDPRDAVPGPAGLRLLADFLSRALSPALVSESPVALEGARPLLGQALRAAQLTVILAGAAVSLALAVGLPLGFLASSAWWAGDAANARTPSTRRSWRGVTRALHGGLRTLITLMRSVHELLWAVLLLAAFGLSELSAVIAIAIPYSGTFAKVFSELLDEAPRDAATALHAAGASRAQAFFFGLVPRAVVDMTAYAFYRFECALRSSAILGFFGYPTLGYYIAASFENLYYGEVWTYLYMLFLLVVVFDAWSGTLRRRFVA